MSWTEERVEQLKKLWSDGFSASQIAAELGGVTRNAVIGKVHRLGLSGRAKTAIAQPQRAKKAPVRQPGGPHARPHGGLDTVGNAALKMDFLPAPKPQLVVAPKVFTLSDAPLVENAGILELTEQTCKWPVGDPGDQSFHFCARRSEGGVPYCGYHARVAYQPASDRRREKQRAFAG
ncbi:MAG: GcrA family cell cycle regulator [Ancalomicrobiaceae bacterium]|nr:GcrA family cell cycle regulator [Ancalomicrobiaceae bacterium]